MNSSTHNVGNRRGPAPPAGGGPCDKLIDGGVFVTFEGPEGVGKSTQVTLLVKALRTAGFAVCQTREPGGTRLGEEIRRLVKHGHDEHAPCPEAELLLMGASRAQHVRQVIAPALVRGEIVVCDRFADSTTVYQGVGRGLDVEFIQSMHRLTVAHRWPILTLVLDMTMTDALQRSRTRNAGREATRKDRFDSEELAFHERVRKGFLKLAENEPGRVRLIDARGDAATVHKRIMKVVESVLSCIS